MASQDILINLEKRDTVRKGLSNLRGNGWVPAVIHDHGKDSILVQGEFVPMTKIYSQAGKHHPVYLQVGDKKHLAMIKQVDLDPRKQQMRHVVFQAIKQNEAVEAEVRIVLEGEVPAERAGFMVISNAGSVIVQALPRDLPDQLTVDASVLKDAGDHLTVADITAPSGVTIITEPETYLFHVEVPKDQVAEADAAAQSLADDAVEHADVPAVEQKEEEPEEAEDRAEPEETQAQDKPQ